MSAYIEDGSGNNENGEVRPIMTGSFHFRVCSTCSVNWILTQNKADHTESVAVCDKCNEISSSSKTYVEIKREYKSSLFENHVKGETVSTCTSSNYPHANMEDGKNLENTSDDDDMSSEKTITGRLLGTSDTLKNVQDIKPEMFLRPAQYTIIQSEEGNVTAGECSLLHKEEKFCKIDNDPVNDNPSNDHVSQINMEDQYPDAMLKGSTPNLIPSRVDDLYSNRKPCCHQCHVCSQIFRYSSALARHERTHFDSLQYADRVRDKEHAFQEVFACSFCFQRFADRMEMMKHKELHTPDPSESCNICQKVFDTELLLREHYKSKHRDIANQLLTCNFCPYTTKDASHFICHVRVHTGVKPYVCTLCDGRFGYSGNLREHIKSIHSQIFQYVCSECGKGCSDKRNLKNHKRVYHNGEQTSVSTELKQTVCSFCFQQFADRMEMIKHQRLHKPDPNEKCGICHKVFDTELLLREHYGAE